MSVKKIQTDNLLYDYFSNLSHFVNISKNLLTANSKQSFVAWFQKMDKLDRRSLILFINDNKDKIPAEYLRFAEKKHQMKYIGGNGHDCKK